MTDASPSLTAGGWDFSNPVGFRTTEGFEVGCSGESGPLGGKPGSLVNLAFSHKFKASTLTPPRSP